MLEKRGAYCTSREKIALDYLLIGHIGFTSIEHSGF